MGTTTKEPLYIVDFLMIVIFDVVILLYKNSTIFLLVIALLFLFKRKLNIKVKLNRQSVQLQYILPLFNASAQT
jgi:hypothetical protein